MKSPSFVHMSQNTKKRRRWAVNEIFSKMRQNEYVEKKRTSENNKDKRKKGAADRLKNHNVLLTAKKGTKKWRRAFVNNVAVYS